MSQATDAMQFFREVVEPTVTEFMADRSSRRRGCLACLALASLSEHYYHACPAAASLKKNEFIGSLRRESWAVGAIADIANATKHCLDDYHRGRWGYEDVQTQQLNVVGIMRAGWPLGGNEVLVGPERCWRLVDLMDTAMTFWRVKLGVP